MFLFAYWLFHKKDVNKDARKSEMPAALVSRFTSVPVIPHFPFRNYRCSVLSIAIEN
jgi:hypothetical protein